MIIYSLDKNNCPVTIAYGIGSKYYFYKNPTLTKSDDDVENNLSGGHYVNVTEFIVDDISQREYMKIASWGKEYYMDFDSFLSHFGFGGSIFTYAT